MNYVKSCLIITMLLGVGYSEPCGDFNQDGGYNVLDIVFLANCILADDCPVSTNLWCIDMNGDGAYNILDIVILASCVLATNCGG